MRQPRRMTIHNRLIRAGVQPSDNFIDIGNQKDIRAEPKEAQADFEFGDTGAFKRGPNGPLEPPRRAHPLPPLNGDLRGTTPIAMPVNLLQMDQNPPAPTQPIQLPPEAFRDPNQFIQPIPPPPVPPSTPLIPDSQNIDIPEIRSQSSAPNFNGTIPIPGTGLSIKPQSSQPIRGRYRF